jgi:Zn-finger nucleic acid-binding protein
MRCPSCDVLLDSLRVGEIELDECPRCLGLWFDRGELHAVLSSRLALKPRPQALSSPMSYEDRDPDAMPEPSFLSPAHPLGPCCRCGGLLLEQKSADHSLAACARCGGFWVPAAAFNTLRAQRTESESTRTSRPAAAVALRGRCPACDTPMRPEDRQGQGYHRCAQCGGVFLPRGGLTFILSHAKGSFEPGPEPKEGVLEHAGCPVCRLVLQPISWQGKPVRVWACTQCWGTFAPASAIHQLQNPQAVQTPGFRGVGGGLWKMLDALVEWLMFPPQRPPQF